MCLCELLIVNPLKSVSERHRSIDRYIKYFKVIDKTLTNLTHTQTHGISKFQKVHRNKQMNSLEHGSVTSGRFGKLCHTDDGPSNSPTQPSTDEHEHGGPSGSYTSNDK